MDNVHAWYIVHCSSTLDLAHPAVFILYLTELDADQLLPESIQHLDSTRDSCEDANYRLLGEHCALVKELLNGGTKEWW